MKLHYSFLLLPVFAFLSSCGSVSKFSPSNAQTTAPASGYTKVIVKNFTHSISDVKVQSKVDLAQKTVADNIASEIIKTGQFTSVSRSGKPDASTLVIGGNIDKYNDGNAALRLVVGFGAGSSEFNATATFSDGKSGKSLGTIVADKNSWALGGGIAATQDADSFIPSVSKHIAKETAAKFGKKTAP
ncbi:MAG: DUF4410 domain-containing protein [Verrucomicrobia bacterium]|nr:MAG: DUF4410 domain-containing protein [Verrucomicrobiota bacterium]